MTRQVAADGLCQYLVIHKILELKTNCQLAMLPALILMYENKEKLAGTRRHPPDLSAFCFMMRRVKKVYNWDKLGILNVV